MLKIIDELLNKITTYRLTLYFLIALVGYAVVLGFLGYLSYSPLDILINTFVAISVSYIANYVFAKIFNAVTNIESVFITALILVLIIPVKFPVHIVFLIGACGLAMASKYLLTIEKRHIFNPAAISVAAIAMLSPEHSAIWWIGTPVMFPLVLIGGLLVARKIQRGNLIFSFLISYLLVIAVDVVIYNGNLNSIINVWKTSIFDSALFFFMFVMLIEPLTSPSTNKLRNYYGVIVALFYITPQLRLLPFAISPELSLCIGNVFTYIVNPNYRLKLILKLKQQLSKDTYYFAFNMVNGFKFKPGQYLEWTLPHKNTDSRGNRRYFSIASSPTEADIGITVKFYQPSSSYKKELKDLMEGKEIIASSLAGDFVMPNNLSIPLVFVAGGVGIAPFRSIIKYLVDNNLKADIVLFYSNRTVNDILFADIFERAKSNGVRTIYTLTDIPSIPDYWQGKTGYITQEMLQEEIPDFKSRKFYLSGPQLMVKSFEKTLESTGVSKNKIKTDYFPGYLENK